MYLKVCSYKHVQLDVIKTVHQTTSQVS